MLHFAYNLLFIHIFFLIFLGYSDYYSYLCSIIVLTNNKQEEIKRMNKNKIAVVAFNANIPIFEDRWGLSRKNLDNMTFKEKCDLIEKLELSQKDLFIRTWETLYDFQEDLNDDEIELHDYFVYLKDAE